MSDMEFNASVEEVVGMVSNAHRGKTRPWGIIVPGEQVQHLLELEACQGKLDRELEQKKRELARVQNRTSQTRTVQSRAEKAPKIFTAALRLVPVAAYLLGASEGLMDPLFAWIMGIPCILSAAFAIMEG